MTDPVTNQLQARLLNTPVWSTSDRWEDTPVVIRELVSQHDTPVRMWAQDGIVLPGSVGDSAANRYCSMLSHGQVVGPTGQRLWNTAGLRLPPFLRVRRRVLQLTLQELSR